MADKRISELMDYLMKNNKITSTEAASIMAALFYVDDELGTDTRCAFETEYGTVAIDGVKSLLK